MSCNVACISAVACRSDLSLIVLRFVWYRRPILCWISRPAETQWPARRSNVRTWQQRAFEGPEPHCCTPHAALNSLTTTASTESTVVLHGNTISSRKKKRCQITRTSQLAGDSLPPRALPGLRLPDDAGSREGGQVAIFSWDGDPAHHTTGALRQAEILKILKRFFPRRLPNPPLCLRIHKMDQACLLGKTFYEHLSYHSLAKGIPACCNPALKPVILPHVSVG